MKKRLKINGLIIFLAVMIVFVFPAFFFRKPRISLWDEAAEVSGVACILLGMLLRASSRGYKSEHSREGRSLIQGGPYALVRNPMYLGILLTGIGIVMVLFNLWAAGIFLALFFLRYITLINKEEERLKAVFGAEYSDYQHRVARLFPPLLGIMRQDLKDYLPLKPLWLKREIGTILAILLAVLAIEGWEDFKGAGAEIFWREFSLSLAVVILFVFLVLYLVRHTARFQKDATNQGKNSL